MDGAGRVKECGVVGQSDNRSVNFGGNGIERLLFNRCPGAADETGNRKKRNGYLEQDSKRRIVRKGISR